MNCEMCKKTPAVRIEPDTAHYVCAACYAAMNARARRGEFDRPTGAF